MRVTSNVSATQTRRLRLVPPVPLGGIVLTFQAADSGGSERARIARSQLADIRSFRRRRGVLLVGRFGRGFQGFLEAAGDRERVLAVY